jgi:hypothetical protein
MEEGKLIVSILALFMSVVSIYLSVATSHRLKNKDIVNERRRLFITALWDKLTSVKGLNTTNATKERVFEVLNTLELVALCWDNDIADNELIVRSFGHSYSERVDEIKGIVSGTSYDSLILALKMDGPRLLRLYPRVEPVRDEIKSKLAEYSKV